MDAYVRLTVFDALTGDTEAFRTSVQINDTSPRFNQKFDFIDIPASSSFQATVFDKSGLIESRLSLTPWSQVGGQMERWGHACDNGCSMCPFHHYASISSS